MILVFDTEALRTKPPEMPWPTYRESAGMSVACTMSYPEGLLKFYSVADEELGDPSYSIAGLADDLEAADLVVSYNGAWWDLPALSKTLGGRYVAPARHYDIWRAIHTALGGDRWPKGSWKLDRVSQTTLGLRKTSEGAMAPSLWANRRLAELFSYVTRDVQITWRLFDHILTYGWVMDPVGNELHLATEELEEWQEEAKSNGQ
ncbi:MAG TPA: ribonuclease H-like domain-containing protein [Thermoleophilia bacterium]|nr:ribonuclease H-like domain-containing protein [Thermoleophilia bacterium]